MKKVIFYFTFSFDEEDGVPIEETHAFLCSNVDLKSKAFNQWIEDDVYAGEFENIEGNYGVHDWSTSPVDGINAIGFTTYEVSKSDVQKLMKEWQNELNKIFTNSVVSDVYLVDGNQNDEDIQKQVELKISN